MMPPDVLGVCPRNSETSGDGLAGAVLRQYTRAGKRFGVVLGSVVLCIMKTASCVIAATR